MRKVSLSREHDVCMSVCVCVCICVSQGDKDGAGGDYQRKVMAVEQLAAVHMSGGATGKLWHACPQTARTYADPCTHAHCLLTRLTV